MYSTSILHDLARENFRHSLTLLWLKNIECNWKVSFQFHLLYLPIYACNYKSHA